MQRTWTLLLAAGMVLLFLTLAAPLLQADMTPPEKSWHGQLEDLALEKAVPGNGVIGNKEDFVKLWKAWMGKEKVPEIDFEKKIVVVLTDRQFTFPITDVVLDVEDGHAHPMFASGRRLGQKEEKKEKKGFAFAIGVFPRAGLKTVLGKKLPSPILVDDLRREIKELQARVEELEGKLSEPELRKLQGTWKVTQFVMEGKDAPAEDRENMQGIIRGNTLRLKGKNKREGEMRIFIDPTAKPAAIDFIPGASQGERMKGIYELDKDKFKACFVSSGPERPKEFSSKKGEKTVLITFQRTDK